MTSLRLTDPQQFVQQANPLLMANGAENHLMIGTARRLAGSGSTDRSILLSCVFSDSRVVGAAAMTPP